MFGILLLSVAGVLFGALRATQLQSGASTDLAQVAAVQRSLDRALTLHTGLGAELAAAGGSAGTSQQSLLSALRTQLDLTWTLKATPEVAAILDTLRQPAAAYFENAEAYVRGSAAGGSDWAFADIEPRRAALEGALREAMTRMRGVLFRVETRVLAEAGRSGTVTAWLISGALFAALITGFTLWAVARSIQAS
ncbi:MAG TPA: hypothetical protein VHN79_10415, partial [Lacunisphaera sp.]|nr:hypothetical protein [Lacunisphaera sp.]